MDTKNAKDAKERYHTESLAEAGVRVYLTPPLGGEEEEPTDWLLVRSVLSEKGRLAGLMYQHALANLASDDEEGFKKRLFARTEFLARLVKGWSFSESPELEEVVEFLRAAPQVADQVDAAAASYLANLKKKSKSY